MLFCSVLAGRALSTIQSHSPHPALTILPDYLDANEQSLLLRHSLRLLDSPSRTTSAGRKRRREWIKSNPTWGGGFIGDEAYDWEEAHFDSVIKQYREMLVREGMWEFQPTGAEPLGDAKELEAALNKIYALLPPSTHASSATGAPAATPPTTSPPSHLILHLLHLSSRGAIYPHVDNLEAFGRTIVGISLGGERIMRFNRVQSADAKVNDSGPANFDVLLSPGSAYIQNEPLRTYYTHEVLESAKWHGRVVGGTQRLSIMLRDKL
ncbi:hypothetical protein B0A53_05360 [Rhodotorula sp. CCFEE 5036]|nr:hypothetical protein B0A53_05360 [Rhodotorula sp. CCFEE 5036]